MTKQAAKVEEAMKLAHAYGYEKAHDKTLAIEEESNGITITLNQTELEILQSLVSSRIGREHNIWYDVTHDETLSANDMAYELAGSILREDRMHRLLEKLHD
jgi:hypothetical protein